MGCFPLLKALDPLWPCGPPPQIPPNAGGLQLVPVLRVCQQRGQWQWPSRLANWRGDKAGLYLQLYVSLPTVLHSHCNEDKDTLCPSWRPRRPRTSLSTGRGITAKSSFKISTITYCECQGVSKRWWIQSLPTGPELRSTRYTQGIGNTWWGPSARYSSWWMTRLSHTTICFGQCTSSKS